MMQAVIGSPALDPSLSPLEPSQKRPRFDTAEESQGVASASNCNESNDGEYHLEPLCLAPPSPAPFELDRCVSSANSSMGGDWRMVLYHEPNLVLYNPREKPPIRSRRLSTEEASSTELSKSVGRCPMCRQTIDSKFANAAQAYFDLLQKVHRKSTTSSARETPEEVDIISESDLYRILGVAPTAHLDDIKRAYRARALMYHPDKNLHDPNTKLKFQKIAEAFSVLSDENKRLKYDKSGDMDLDGFDMDQFMNMVNASGAKPRKNNDLDLDEQDVELMDLMMEETNDNQFSSDPGSNPFLLAEPPEVPVGEVIASEGGAEAEATATAALRHLPPGLLNTGYYARFFVETKELGSGSFGAVYLCRHVLDDLELGDYAVKKVPVGDNKVWLRNMVREVKTFERLHHPNIVEYKHSWLELSRRSDFCPLVPFLFILMQYCNGGSLDELLFVDGNPLHPKQPLAVTQVWRFLLDVLLGLQHLHRQGILHRDLKPTNILLQWQDSAGGRSRRTNASGTVLRALLSDFGTATPLGEVPSGLTTRGYTGTVEYTAPELLTGAVEYSEKSDMWSCGIALYAMCFSALPFSHDDPSVLKGIIRSFVENRQQGSTDGAAWLPPDTRRLGRLRLVVSALLALDPARRPTAADLLENHSFRTDAMRHTRHPREVDLDDQVALPNS